MVLRAANGTRRDICDVWRGMIDLECEVAVDAKKNNSKMWRDGRHSIKASYCIHDIEATVYEYGVEYDQGSQFHRLKRKAW